MKVEVWREVKWECPYCGNTNDLDHWHEAEVINVVGYCGGCKQHVGITGERK